MKKLLTIVFLMATSLMAKAQNSAVSGYCTLGATSALISGLPSLNTLQGIVPGCTVTVYLSGTQTPATIYATAGGQALGNPFVAVAKGLPNAGSYLFYAAQGVPVDIVLSGGTSPNVYQTPVTVTGVNPGGGGGSGGNYLPLTGGTLTGTLTAPGICNTSEQIDARCYGAKGDAILDTSNTCSMASGSSTLTCTDSPFTAANVGEEIYIAGAGASSGTLVSTVASYVSASSVRIAGSSVGSVSGAYVIVNHDDTTGLQAAYNAAIAQNKSLFIPSGQYVHHGLNWTNNSIKIASDAYSAARLIALNVTNPGSTTSSPTKVGVDISNSGYNQVTNVAFYGGFQTMNDMAPKVNVLGARTGSTGNAISIAHIFDNDFFLSFGQYNVYLYGYEQTSFIDPHMESSTTLNSGVLTLSSENTAGIVSPYTTVVTGDTSMTKVSITGARSVVAGAGNMIVLDQGAHESIYSLNFRDIYSNMSAGTSGAFLSDTGTLPIRNVELNGDYIEPGNCSACQAVNLTAPAWQWNINNTMLYNNNGLSTNAFSFAGGILDSEVMIDASGQTTSDGFFELSASSCAGSTLHLGQTQPTTNCVDYLNASDVTGGRSTVRTAFNISAAITTGWIKLGTFKGSASAQNLTIRFGEGANYTQAAGTAAYSTLEMRLANNATAPNLNDLFVSSVGSTGILAVKAAATGGSTSAANYSWDVYVDFNTVSLSNYTVDIPQGTSWINSATNSTDPGTASTTVYVGRLLSTPAGPAPTGADQLFGTTSSSTALSWLQLINCSNGTTQALEYSTTSHTFSCVTISSAGSGTVTASPQYDIPYYNTTGTANTILGVSITGPVIASATGAPTGPTGTCSGSSSYVDALGACHPATPIGTTAQVPIYPGAGAAAVPQTISGCTITAGGVLTCLPGIVALSGTTPAITAGPNTFYSITLSGATTPTISGLVAGDTLFFHICQGGTAYTWAWPAAFKSPSTVGSTINTCTNQQFVSLDGSTLTPNGVGVSMVTP